MNKFSFRPLSFDALPLLHEWLEKPHVTAFWDQDIVWTKELIQEKYGSYIEGYKVIDGMKKPMRSFIVYWDGAPIGYIQYYNAFDFPRDGYDLQEALKGVKTLYPVASLDLFIGKLEMIGKGLGSAAMKQLLKEYIWKDFASCYVDPDLNNQRAIRAYENAGFCKIKILGQQIQMMMAARSFD